MLRLVSSAEFLSDSLPEVIAIGNQIKSTVTLSKITDC